eukprot:TRINITY_DN2668_c0_g2_i3.p1 TRINITY_DN2668_c0_g2~~TRINITY_DN2668_c0_g2_i3.p1  ORF type:complete len:492 (-),score=113.19 TRINITY_DN2668_c0_g2_i3:835-2310(-)
MRDHRVLRRLTLIEMPTITLFSLLSFAFWITVAQQDSCSSGTSDFGIVYNGNTAFSVSQANGTCSCPGGFTGSGSRLSGLDSNPTMANLVALVASLNATVASLQAQLASATAAGAPSADGYNLAYKKNVTASSMYNDTVLWGPSNLVDMTVNTTFISEMEAQPWFQVDLGAHYTVSRIIVGNRWDCCPERLGLFYVFAASFDMNQTRSPTVLASMVEFSTLRNVAEMTDRVITIPVYATGPVRYVRIQLSGQHYLQVSELQVYSGQAPQSCSQLHSRYPQLPSNPYIIDPDGAGPVAAAGVYCDMYNGGGGWTMTYRVSNTTNIQYLRGSLNGDDMARVYPPAFKQAAKVSDAFMNALGATEVWSICGGRQTIFLRNTTTPWASNIGQNATCAYEANTYRSVRKDFDDQYQMFSNASMWQYYGGCGAMNYLGPPNMWTVVMAIFTNDQRYLGCYDGCSMDGTNTSTCSPAPAQYATPWRNTWNSSGFVFMR